MLNTPIPASNLSWHFVCQCCHHTYRDKLLSWYSTKNTQKSSATMMSNTEIMVAGCNAPTLSFITLFNITEVSFSGSIRLNRSSQVSTHVGHVIRNPFLCGSHEIYNDNSGEI